MMREVKLGEWIYLEHNLYHFVSSSAELYAVPKSGDGLRSYLANIDESEKVFGFVDQDMQLLALITKEGSLDELPFTSVESLKDDELLIALNKILPDKNLDAINTYLSKKELIENSIQECVEKQQLFWQERELYFRSRLDKREDEKEDLHLYGWINLLKHNVDCQQMMLDPKERQVSSLTIALKMIALHYSIPTKIIIDDPNLNEEMLYQEKIRGILRNSGLYARKVSLSHEWFKKDQGALLVFYKGLPVAAIPKSSNEYNLLNGTDSIKVTSEVAQYIDTEAYIFNITMPRRSLSVGELAKWCFKFSWKQDRNILIWASFFAGLIPIITPFITDNIFSNIIPSVDKQALLLVVQVMFVSGISVAILNLARGMAVLRLKYHIRQVAESALWLRCLSLPASFFRKYQIGDLAQRMNGIGNLSHALSDSVASSLFNGMFIFWNLGVMLYYSPKLTILAVVVWGIYLIAVLLILKQLLKKSTHKLEADSENAAKSLQLLSGIHKFRLRGSEEQAFAIWSRSFGEKWHWDKSSRWSNNWIDLLGQVQPVLLTFFLYWLTMHYLKESQTSGIAFLSVPEFMGFNSALSSFGSSLSAMLPAAATMLSSKPFIDRLMPILEEEPEISDQKKIAPLLTGDIEISSLDFRYRESGPLVLKNVDISINAGEFVAIVGSSGSGKSTLLRLILGLEVPQKGLIQYNGQNLQELNIASVRRQMGVVMQHGTLMAGSIKDNVAGSLIKAPEEIWKALAMVGLDNEVRDMPMGIETIISEGAGNISGGQKQRILIARSLVHRPKIIVFDEATSALDNITQDIVSSSLDKMNATRIVVAHRLSTIQNADKIIVLDQGQVAETGTYEELMERDGLFKQLAMRQLV